MSSCNPYKNLFGSTDVVYTLGMGAAKKAIFLMAISQSDCDSVLFCSATNAALQSRSKQDLLLTAIYFIVFRGSE